MKRKIIDTAIIIVVLFICAGIITSRNKVSAKTEETITTIETGKIDRQLEYKVIKDTTTGVRYLIVEDDTYSGGLSLDIQVLYDNTLSIYKED